MSTKSKRFDDQAYIDAFNLYGEYPKIHQDIASVIRKFANEAEPCLDLGACTNLLSRQSIALGRSLAIAVESNPKSIERAVQHPKIVGKKLLLITRNLPIFESILQEYKPTLVIARRVFPELEERSPGIVKVLGKLFAENGVQKIILEGRQTNPKATNVLSGVELEVQQFSEYYQVQKVYKNVRFLELNERL